MSARTSLELLVALVVLAGCKDECPAAREAASEEILAAHREAVALREKRRDEAKAAQGSLEGLKARADVLVSRLRQFEDTMGCVQHPHDCCEKLAKRNLHDRIPIQQAALDVSRPQLPLEVAVLMTPLADHTHNIDAIGTGAKDLGVIVPWCTKARELIAQIRKGAPAAWKAATDEVSTALLKAKNSALSIGNRVELLERWSAAVAKSASATIPDNAEDTRARVAMEKYQSACH